METQTKVCKRCRQTKPVTDFTKRSCEKDGLSYWCRPCNAQARKARTQDLYDRVDELKSKPCTDCGQTFDPICMDFDHTGTDKLYNIGKLVFKGRPWEMIETEIAKCELVCSNCHRLRTKRRQQKKFKSPS